MNNKTHFRHYIKNGYGFTIATVVENNSVYAGLSFCSPKDQFSRKKGRLIAESRAKKLLETRDRPSRYAICYSPGPQEIKPEDIKQLVTDLINNKFILKFNEPPSWYKKFAKDCFGLE